MRHNSHGTHILWAQQVLNFLSSQLLRPRAQLWILSLEKKGMLTIESLYHLKGFMGPQILSST